MNGYDFFFKKYAASKNIFWKTLFNNAVPGFVIGPTLTTAIYLGVLNEDTDLSYWLLIIIAALIGGWTGTLIALWQSQPLHIISKTYQSLVQSFSSCNGLIQAEMAKSIIEIRNRLSNLSSHVGESWSYEDRINVAHSLLEGLDTVEKYWATATDAPYASSNTLDAFYLLVREKLAYADVRRLLVFPLNKLLENLKSDENQQNMLRFLKIHQSESNKIASQNKPTQYKYELRYWPATIKDLQNNLKMQNPPVMVDMAIINDSIVFGQETNEDDNIEVSGNGHVVSDPLRASMYLQAFENIWTKRKSDSYPPAQLEAYIDLLGMRSKISKQKKSLSSTKPGIPFYRATIEKVRNSLELRAIDVAPRPEDWVSKSEYWDFLQATIESANKHKGSYHGRIFVLREPLCRGTAQVFLKNVILPQVKASIIVHIHRTVDMFDKNLAAIDCIFNSDGWGFYLLPTDEFKEDKLFAEQNQIHPKYVDPFFHSRFERLAKLARFKCRKEEDCDDPALFHYLTQIY